MASGSGYFKTSYGADIALFDTTFRRFWLGVFLLGLLAFPFIASAYHVHLINIVFIYAIVALGLNMLTGYTGLISLGHAGLFAAGAYVVAVLQAEFGLPFLLILPASLVVGAILGFLMGLPALRLRALYLVLGTMAMHTILTYAGGTFQKSKDAYKWGITIQDPALGPLFLSSDVAWYFFLLVVVGVTAVFCINLVRSRVGRAWVAIRDRDVAAQVLGVDIAWYKLLAFTFSGSVTAMAGCLWAYYARFVTIEDFAMTLGVTFVAMVIVGGLSSILGSILGAAFITLLPYVISDLLRALPGVPPAFKAQSAMINLVLFGLFMIAFLLFEPMGLVGVWVRVRNYFELWPFRYRRAISTGR